MTQKVAQRRQRRVGRLRVRPAGMEEAQGMSKDGGHKARLAAMAASVLCARSTEGKGE